MKKILYIFFAMLAIAANANVLQRGVNKKLIWFSADGSGTQTSPYILNVVNSGNVTNSYQDRDFLLAVQMGKVPGHKIYRKFGRNAAITTATDPEDVWEGGGLYTYDATNTAPIVSIASSNAGDTQPTLVEGLAIDGAFTNMIVTLSGTTRTALPIPLWRVFRMRNQGSASYIGNAFVYTGTGAVPSIGDPEVRALILNGNNQTQMAVFTVPKGDVGYILQGEVSMEFAGGPASGTEVSIDAYYVRPYGGLFSVQKSITLISTGNSIYQYMPKFTPIPALSDIRIEVTEVSDDMGATAEFEILCVDEGLFSTNYLQSIGQPGY